MTEAEILLQLWADILADVQTDKAFTQQVERAEPSGNDFLADALNQPRRHKRKG